MRQKLTGMVYRKNLIMRKCIDKNNNNINSNDNNRDSNNDNFN